MSVRHVADMLALAGQGLHEASKSGDTELLAKSTELAVRALAHPEAQTFFVGLQLALAEDSQREATDVAEDAVSDAPDKAGPYGRITTMPADVKELPYGNDPGELDNGLSPFETNSRDGVVVRRRLAG